MPPFPDIPLSIIPKIFGYLTSIYRRFFPKKFGYAIAPNNILEVIQPYTSKGKVIELLGQPHADRKQIAAYRFKNALMQIRYGDNDIIESVTLGTLSLRWPNRFSIFPTRYVLGENSFGDVDWDHEQAMYVNMSSKFFSVSRTAFFGFSGRYLYFTFALINAATYPVIGAKINFHKADPDDSFDSRKSEPYHDVKFNMVTLANYEDAGMDFSWEFFM